MSSTEEKQARRPKGEGTAPRQLADGRWRSELTIGTDANGKRERKVVYGATKSECSKNLRAVIADRDNGILTNGRPPTLAEWMHHWLENIAPTKVRPRTLVGYRSYVRTWVDTSKVAKTRLDKLTPEHLEQLYKPMRDAGRSESTVAQLHRILSRALTVAVRRGRVATNPAQRMDAPQQASFDPEVLSPDDARKLRVAAENTPGGARWLIALALGLRQGEALGLAWDKIDIEGGQILVHRELYSLPWEHGCPESEADPKAKKPCGRRADHCKDRHSGGRFVGAPKSDAGKRTVPLPEQLVPALLQHRAEQLRARAEEGTRWRGFTAAGGEKLDLVFCQRDGNAIQASKDWQSWQEFLKASGVPAVRVHDARHTAATLLLLMGVDGRVVMDIMGWSVASMLKRYQHVLDVMRVDAGKKMGAALWTAPAEPEPDNGGVVSMADFRARKKA
ncbi:tyrosine-type recombinase/integrase [Paenarthrobacter sp. C1]|uniref:tyrosine-type recombinase/integrase n=1 Tax=Paenarthrobacter sp. C1 TaxID=3400220 RepID=UPI003BF55C39